VRVAPADVGDAWTRAARETSQLVASLPAGERDCREIVLELQPRGGATVAMTTGDGRLAVRPVSRPDEVVPMAMNCVV